MTPIEYNQHETTHEGQEIIVHWYKRNGQIAIATIVDTLGDMVSIDLSGQKEIKEEIINKTTG